MRETLVIKLPLRLHDSHFATVCPFVLLVLGFWKDGIPHYGKHGLKAFEDCLSDRGVKNIQTLNEVLQGAKPWHA